MVCIEYVLTIFCALQIFFVLDTTILLARCPKEYLHIMIYIDRIQYYDDPDFAIIRGKSFYKRQWVR